MSNENKSTPGKVIYVQRWANESTAANQGREVVFGEKIVFVLRDMLQALRTLKVPQKT